MGPISTSLSGLDVYHLMRQDAVPREFMASALWRARSFAATAGEPMTVRRAKAFAAVLEQVELIHVPGELLCGSSIARFVPKTAALEREFESLQHVLREVGSRDFTSSWDHLAADYGLLLREGFAGVRRRALESLERHEEPKRRLFLQSVLITLDAAVALMHRWGDRLEQMAVEHVAHESLLREQSAMLHRLATEPARDFRDAVQLTWTLQTLLQLDDRWAMALGRLDQYLYPYYRADIDSGAATDEQCQAMLDHLFGKLTGLGGDIQNIAVGGLTPDGADATNELSFMILEACRRVGQPGGNCTARIHRRTSEAFLRKCAEVIRSGIGYPAVVSDEVYVPALAAQGFPLAEARDYCPVGCIETFIPGRVAPWSDSRFNLLECVNLVLFDGVDSLTGRRLASPLGEPASWEEFLSAYVSRLQGRLREHIEELNAYKRRFEDRAFEYTSPFVSAFVSDCLDRGLDLCDGGARYPANHGVAAMGIGVTADALAAIKRFVYDEGTFTLAQLREMLQANFEGFEAQRQMLLRGAPKYGNDDPEVDAIAVAVTRALGNECAKYRTPSGGFYWALMAANVQNVSAGREVGASPDGRLAREPLSDAASPTFGRDTHGLTAALRSVAKLPYHLCPGGNVINIKLHPSLLEGDRGLATLASLVRTCFGLGGAQLQFNTVDRDVLREAMQQPERFGSLVVRVSGFSAHFVQLEPAVQEDILQRTQHRSV